MKKVFLPMFFAILGALAFLVVQNNTPKAAAFGSQSNILSVEAEELTEATIVANSYRSITGLSGLQAGDFRVDLKLYNGTGYSLLGLSMYYDDSNFECYLDNDPSNPPAIHYAACLEGPASQGLNLVCIVNTTSGIVGFGTNGNSNCNNSGAIASVFFKRKQNAPNPAAIFTSSTSVDTFMNKNYVSLTYTEVQPHQQQSHTLLEYMLGDIDGDGVVTAADSSLLSAVISSTNVTLTAANAEAYFVAYSQSHNNVSIAGMYVDNIFVFDVADINFDASLTSTDSSAILLYFTYVTAHIDPTTDPTTKNIGQTGYYVA